MLKKIAAAFVAAVMLANTSAVMAAENGNNDYTALGDSIASGYGLNDPTIQSYPALFANKKGLALVNLAVDGKTSQQLLDEIKDGKYDLSNAEVITVSIGSNDIMKPMIATLAKGLGVDPNTKELDKAIVERIEYLRKYESTTALRKRLKNMEASITDNAEFFALCDTAVKTNIPSIAQEIKRQNPDVQLIFTNFYNPFKNKALKYQTYSYDVGGIIQPYIDRLNSGLETSDDYKIADVYGAFDSTEYVNVQINLDEKYVTFDPHPSQKGHRQIYLAVCQVYEESFLYGDADCDGRITASDSAATLQKVLVESYKTGLEKRTDDWKKYTDVDGDEMITASDAAAILQKVLNESYEFAVEKAN